MLTTVDPDDASASVATAPENWEGTMTTNPIRDDDTHEVRQMAAMTVVTFAGVMLMITAVMQVLEGIAAIADDTIFLNGADYVYELDVTTWGWVHLVIGLLGLATAVGIMTNQFWGQLGGIAIAATSALFSFAFLPYFPLWTIVVIALDVLVIWALCNRISASADV